MKKITDVVTKEEMRFTVDDLPMMIHGHEHTGASMLSITVAALLHGSGRKLCIFTAYPAAKEDFIGQIGSPSNVFCLEDEKFIEQSFKFQTVIVKPGDIELYLKTVSNFSFERDRIVFIKNIETIGIPIFDIVSTRPFIVAGDAEKNPSQESFLKFEYCTKICTTNLPGEKPLELHLYQARMKRGRRERTVMVV